MIPLDTHQEQIKHSRSVNAQTNNLLTFVNISSYIPHERFFFGGGEDWGDRCTAICFLLCYKKIIVKVHSVKLICVFFLQLPGPKTHKVSQKRISQNLSGKDFYSVPYSGEGIGGISRKSTVLLPIQFIFMSDL